jgi:hypothetical protein
MRILTYCSLEVCESSDFLKSNHVTAVLLSLNYDVCCLSEHPVLEYQIEEIEVDV